MFGDGVAGAAGMVLLVGGLSIVLVLILIACAIGVLAWRKVIGRRRRDADAKQHR
jgi:membrane protein implicated in regulation of membrane protease activity